jgi:serine/threonine protein kinase
MEYDDDKTAVRRPSGRPPPGAVPAAPTQEGSPNVLPAGTRLAEFEVISLIGEGGFGIVYLAYDHSLNRHVALKEYMPAGMASRSSDLTVTVRSKHHAETFAAGLKSFMNEARLLAQFDSPSLVKVYRFWEGNRTAYMVMPFYEGMTLKDAFKQRRIVPDEAWIKSFLANLLGAVETIHRVQCYHRDIAPDNILLLKDGRPLLLDFGAARRVIGDLTQGPTVILKPGYAPIEQYAEIPGLRQGAWTDVYAIAAVVYFLMTGKAPPPAVARIVNDEMVPARQAARGRYTDYFLATIDVALAVKPEQRIQSVANLRRALDIGDNTSRSLPPIEPQQASPAGGRIGARPQPQPDSATRGAATQAAGAPTARPGPANATNASTATTANWTRPLMSDSKDFGPQRRNGALEWMIFAILLSAGIAGGFYWGANQFSFPLPWQAAAPKADSAPSPGLLARQEQGTDGSKAPSAQAPAPAPASAPGSGADTGTSTVPPALPDRQVSDSRVAQARLPDRPAPAVPSRLAQEQAAPSDPQAKATPAAAPPTPRPSPEEESWTTASASNQQQDYEAYLKQYPAGRHAASARSRIDRLQKTAAARDSAESAPEVASRGAPVPAAKPSEDEELWQAASAVGKVSAYEAYLRKYPKGHYAGIARDRLETARYAEAVGAQAKASAPAATDRAAAPVARASAEPAPALSSSASSPSTEPSSSTASASSTKPSPSALASSAASATPPSASRQQAEPGARTTPAPADQVAAIHPPEAGIPDAAPARATRVIRLANKTMTGDFTSDPVSGIVSGRGRIEWSNGDRFEGTLVRGLKEGQGVFVWSNGQRYRGQWSHDQPNGKGALTFPNGNRYEGGIRDGLPQGEGATHFTSGDVHRGRYADGKMQGQGRYTWANGSYWEGNFKNDQRTGEGKLVFSEKALEDARALARASTGKPQTASGGEREQEASGQE